MEKTQIEEISETESTKGFELMFKMGCEKGDGLGKNGDVIKEPENRKGAGSATQANAIKQKETFEICDSKSTTKTSFAEITSEEDILKKFELVRFPSTKPRRELHDINQQLMSTKNCQKSTATATNESCSNQANTIAKTNIEKVTTSPSKMNIKINTPPLPAASATGAIPKSKSLPKFSFSDRTTPRFFSLVSQTFQNEIKNLQSHFIHAATLQNPLDQSLIIARVYMQNKKVITDYTFEFIRNDLVGCIGNYQNQQLPTPIFHSMTNNETYLTIICENTYAYECLQQCIADISAMPVLNSISVKRLPPKSDMVYLFDAVYSGIIRDPELFLHQVKLHRKNLNADHWIIVSHEVHIEKRATMFLLLIDEPSALALTYHYNKQIYVCTQQVIFTKRQIV